MGVIYIPVTLLLAAVAVGPTLDEWTLVWFNVVFEVGKYRACPFSELLIKIFNLDLVPSSGVPCSSCDLLGTTRICDGIQLREGGKDIEYEPQQV